MEIRSLPGDMALLNPTAPQGRNARLAAVLFLPMERETLENYIILPGLLSECCRAYPDKVAFQRKLNQLYGASVTCKTINLGGYLMLTFSVGFLRPAFIPDHCDLTREATDLLLDMLTDPLLEDGGFPADSIEQNQRVLLESIRSQQNNKRMYARDKATDLLYAGDPRGMDVLGDEDRIRAITPRSAELARQMMLKVAKIRWIAQGIDDLDTLEQTINARFAALPPRAVAVSPVAPPYRVNKAAVTEEMAMKQTKLVMGFVIDATEPADDRVMAARVMNALWGGCATSLLFRHVREEQSLCYYCLSTYNRCSGGLLVDSGIKAEDAEKVQEEVLKQLRRLQEGDFTDEELEDARRHLIQQFISADETADSRESWYSSQTLFDCYHSPEEAGRQLAQVTREDVCRVAQTVQPAVVYCLKPKEEKPC